MLQKAKNEAFIKPVILFIKRGQDFKKEFVFFGNISNRHLIPGNANFLILFSWEVISSRKSLVNTKIHNTYSLLAFT